MISLMGYGLFRAPTSHEKISAYIYSPSQAVVQQSLFFLHCPLALFPLLLQEIQPLKAVTNGAAQRKRIEKKWGRYKGCPSD